MELKPYCIAALASTVQGAANTIVDWSVVDCIVDLRCRGKIFLSPQLRMQNGLREPNHAHLRDDLSSLWQDLIKSPYVPNLIALASDFPEIWMLPKNLKRVT